MERWRLINLGPLDPYSVHSVYEAVAKSVSEGASLNTLILCYPKTPYVCIGVHQILEFEVDLEKCRKMGIEVVRRQVGGGATYLDDGQQFYHIIVNMNHDIAKKGVEHFYRTLLQPVAEVYKSFGLNARYKPLNDVIVDGKKISGNGAARLYDSWVLIGNIILDFNHDAMAEVLKFPSEKFKDKFIKNVKLYVTSLRRELGYIPPRNVVVERLVEMFSKNLNIEFDESSLTPKEKDYLEMLKNKYSSREWLYMHELKYDIPLSDVLKYRKIKVKEGQYIVQVDYKALKLIRLIAEIRDNKISDITISGDFFVQPYTVVSLIEENLKGSPLEEKEFKDRIKKALESSNASLSGSGITVEDLVNALMKLRERLEIL